MSTMGLEKSLWLLATLIALSTAGLYAFLAGNIWIRSRWLSKTLPPESRQVMRRFRDISVLHDTLYFCRVGLAYDTIGVLISALTASAGLGLLVAAGPLTLLGWLRVRTTTTPVALILGTENADTVKRHHAVKRRLSPLRVVSLLDVHASGSLELGYEMALDSLRTGNVEDWWLVVTSLMDMTPIISIDAAAETRGVCREMRYILECKRLWRRSIFLVPAEEPTPVFDRMLQETGRRREELQIARYNEEPWLIAETVKARRGLVARDRTGIGGDAIHDDRML